MPDLSVSKWREEQKIVKLKMLGPKARKFYSRTWISILYALHEYIT